MCRKEISLTKVIKRDCTEVDFNKEKISTAILKAMKNGSGIVRPEIADDIANEIEAECSNKEEVGISEIELMVYNKLISKHQLLTARAYEGYRSVREFQRENENTIDGQIEELLNGNSDYWNNENSNKDAKILTTQRDYMAGILSTDITRRFLLSPEIVQAHDEGIIHFHDADYFAQNAIHNCFSGSTKFITDEGVKRFDEFYDGDIVKVLDINGEWKDATVHTYGKQKMYDVIIGTQKTEHKITCTANHRWVLKDGRITTNLKIGDTLYPLKNTTMYEPKTLNEYKWFCFGFVLGDGMDLHSSNNMCGVESRLCGDKNKLLSYFIKAGYQKRNKTQNGDNFVFNKKTFSKQAFLNNNCWKLLDLKSKIALFHGYYAADGFKLQNGIATADERLALMIEEISALAGYHITSKRDEVRDTPYKKNARLITFRFVTKQQNNWLWKVKDIKPHFEYEYDKSDSVNKEIVAWCVEEPTTHTFTLSGGIVTGNCCLINLDDMLQNGTVINKIKIEKPQ